VFNRRRSSPPKTEDEAMSNPNSDKIQRSGDNEKESGRVLVPALLWMAGVPFGIVLLLWFFFFRG
jgi:hypothetical protein